MALHKGAIITMALAVPYSLAAGALVAQTVTVEIDPEKHVVGDIIEVACLPADHRFIDALIAVPAEIGGTADLGVLTGDFNQHASETTTPRELDGLIYKDAALAAGVVRVTEPGAFTLSKQGQHRGIGLEIKTAPTAKGSLRLTILYVA
ncbi:hypothetical protein ACRRRS_21945 (plasmid) [Brucella anthropi]|uniref:hypothetical protein n=1 Tax=Brucella anthropi TaxID=529 RepID=UPI001BD1ADB9